MPPDAKIIIVGQTDRLGDVGDDGARRLQFRLDGRGGARGDPILDPDHRRYGELRKVGHHRRRGRKHVGKAVRVPVHRARPGRTVGHAGIEAEKFKGCLKRHVVGRLLIGLRIGGFAGVELLIGVPEKGLLGIHLKHADEMGDLLGDLVHGDHDAILPRRWHLQKTVRAVQWSSSGALRLTTRKVLYPK